MQLKIYQALLKKYLLNSLIVPYTLLFLTCTSVIFGVISNFDSILGVYSKVGHSNFFLALLFSFIFLYVFSKLLNLKIQFTFQLLLLLLAFYSGNLINLLSVYVILLTSFCIGKIYQLDNGYSYAISTALLRIILGLGTLGLLIGLIAHFPISSLYLYIAILIIPIAFNIIELKKLLIIFLKDKINFIFGFKLDIQVLFLMSLGIIYYITAIFPETRYDALVHHLFVPEHIKQRGMWDFNMELYVFAALPMLSEWIYSISNMIGNETAARFINITFIFISTKIIYDKVLAFADKNCASISSIFFLSTPLIYCVGSSLFTDALVNMFLLSAILISYDLIGKSYSKKSKYNIYILTMLLGFSIATKPNGAVYTFIIFAFSIPFLLKNYRHIGSFVLVKAIMLLTITGGISYLYSYYISGNPFYPFANGIFKSPLGHPSNWNNPLFNTHFSPLSIYEFTFNAKGKYLESGLAAGGFSILLLFLPLLYISIKQKFRYANFLSLFSFISIVIIFEMQSYLRYIIPLFSIIYIFLGVTFFRALNISKVFYNILFLIAFVSISLNLFFINTASSYSNFPVETLNDGRSEYIRNNLPIRDAIEYVNSLENLDDSPILIMSNPLTAGLRYNALYVIWYNPSMQAQMIESNSTDKMLNTLKSRKVKYVIVDTNWEPYWAKGYWGEESVTKLLMSVTKSSKDFGAISVRVLE